MPSDRSPAPWTAAERAIFAPLTTPRKIQDYLDAVEYSAESRYRSPRSVMRDRLAHCFDGAMFAAAALRRLGYPPQIVDMQAVRDDDHVIAIFRRNGCVGAVAKSNFSGIRYREPVYRSVRELVMSYFEPYYSLNYKRSLRCYAGPLDLRRYESIAWQVDDAAMDVIGDKLCDMKTTPIMTPAMIRALTPVDQRTYDAGMLGVNMKGVYIPPPTGKSRKS